MKIFWKGNKKVILKNINDNLIKFMQLINKFFIKI